MSLVQIAYQTILTKMRDWSRLENKDRMQILHQASSLFGQSFRAALNLLQKNIQKLQIFEYDHFYLMIIKHNSKTRLNDCTCKISWLRKVGESAPYLCFHQIVLELSLCFFNHKIRIQKIDCSGTAQLAEYLQIIK